MTESRREYFGADYSAAERYALDKSGDGTSYAVVADVYQQTYFARESYLVTTLAFARTLARRRYHGEAVWEVVYKGPRWLSATAYDRGEDRTRSRVARRAGRR
jgi:hypothetical protein